MEAGSEIITLAADISATRPPLVPIGEPCEMINERPEEVSTDAEVLPAAVCRIAVTLISLTSTSVRVSQDSDLSLPLTLKKGANGSLLLEGSGAVAGRFLLSDEAPEPLANRLFVSNAVGFVTPGLLSSAKAA